MRFFLHVQLFSLEYSYQISVVDIVHVDEEHDLLVSIKAVELLKEEHEELLQLLVVILSFDIISCNEMHLNCAIKIRLHESCHASQTGVVASLDTYVFFDSCYQRF